MKILFALQGNQGTGKTTTIGILFETMKNTGYSVVKDKYKRGSRDFFVVVEKAGKRVGISTYGDTKRQVEHRIKCFKAHSCEIIVCACHKNGVTVEVLYNHGYDVCLVEKSVSKNKTDQEQNRINNTKDAGVLLAKVNEALAVSSQG